MNTGGPINRAMRTAQHYARGGLINSSVPGRTDKHPMKVQAGSYVIPADVVSGLGENNTMAGAERLKKIFNANQGPYGSTQPKLKTPRISTGRMKGTQMSARSIRQRFAEGGPTNSQYRGPQLGQDSVEWQRTLSKMAPQGLPWQSWRQSENVEDRRPGGQEYDPFDERFPKQGGEWTTGYHDGQPVDIIVAGGEFMLSPDQVTSIGGGDPERGFKILDAFVKVARQKNIKTLKGLPPPKK